jgi:hypothetical protein
LPAPCEKREEQLREDLMTWAGYIEAGHSHTEKLAHEIFYVITAIIVAIWVLGNHYLAHVQVGGYLNILSAILALTGLVGTYKLQESVSEAHVIVNRIKKEDRIR